MELGVIECDGMEWIQLAYDGIKNGFYEYGNEHCVHKKLRNLQ
jgi:hypothetical protein